MFDVESFLAGVEPFRGLNQRILRGIAASCDVVTFQPGLVFAEASQPAEAMWLIHSGLVSLCIQRSREELLPVQILGPKGAFGYGALLEEWKFLLSARTLTAGTALRVPKDALARELGADVQAATEVYKSLLRDLLWRLALVLDLVSHEAAGVPEEVGCPFGLPFTLATFTSSSNGEVIGACPLVGTCPVGMERGCPIATLRPGAAPRIWPPPIS